MDDAHYTNGLKFTVSGITSIDDVTVNGLAPAEFGGSLDIDGVTLTAVDTAHAVTVGAHAFNVVVTSANRTGSILVAYQVTANQVNPTVSVTGGTPDSSYEFIAATADSSAV